MNEDIDDLITETINRTIFKLKVAGLMKDTNRSAFQKTEDLLRNYKAFNLSEDPSAKEMIRKIDTALRLIHDDPYYVIVPAYYIEGMTREELAYHFNTTVTTISRNKTRLVEKLKVYLFSDDVIKEIYS